MDTLSENPYFSLSDLTGPGYLGMVLLLPYTIQGK